MQLKDSVAIVTGGAGDLGSAIVEMLLLNNTKVAVLDSNKRALDTIDDCANLLKINCDLTDEIDVSNAINRVMKSFSRVDVLINNAGIIYSEPLIKIMSKKKRHSLETWQEVVNVNLTAPFVLTSYVAEQMVLTRRSGVIVNISSISATGNAGQSAYSAAKAGIEALSTVWAKELGRFNIRSVAIAPGFIETKSTGGAVSSEVLKHVKSETPLKRLGTVQEVAHTVKYVIENDFVNGKILKLDGGLTI